MKQFLPIVPVPIDVIKIYSRTIRKISTRPVPGKTAKISMKMEKVSVTGKIPAPVTHFPYFRCLAIVVPRRFLAVVLIIENNTYI